MDLYSAASYEASRNANGNIATVPSLASDIDEVQVTFNMAEGPTDSLPMDLAFLRW